MTYIEKADGRLLAKFIKGELDDHDGEIDIDKIQEILKSELQGFAEHIRKEVVPEKRGNEYVENSEDIGFDECRQEVLDRLNKLID